MHVVGGVLKGGRLVEGEAIIAGKFGFLFYCHNLLLYVLFSNFFAISYINPPLFSVLTVLDTAAGVWLDRNGLVTSSRKNRGHEYDPSLELMRRCRHAAAAVGGRIYIFGGLRGGETYNTQFRDEVVTVEL